MCVWACVTSSDTRTIKGAQLWTIFGVKISNCRCDVSAFTVWMTEVWMTILESGWNLWVWLVGVVSRRWVWLVGGIYGYGYHV